MLTSDTQETAVVAVPASTCEQCGAEMAAEQTWCLECGTAAILSGARRRNRRTAVLVLSGVMAFAGGGSALAYVTLSDQADRSASQIAAAAVRRPAEAARAAASASPSALPVAPAGSAAITRDPLVHIHLHAPRALAPTAAQIRARLRIAAALRRRLAQNQLVKLHGALTHRPKIRKIKPTPQHPLFGNGISPIAAVDYDPAGNGSENPGLTRRAIDGDPSTSWSTVRYPNGLTKAGVGLYVDSSTPVALRALGLITPTPGFPVSVYGANDGPPATVPGPGWTLLGQAGGVGSSQKIALNTQGTAFRYYLVWMTGLAPGFDHLALSEISLLSQ